MSRTEVAVLCLVQKNWLFKSYVLKKKNTSMKVVVFFFTLTWRGEGVGGEGEREGEGEEGRAYTQLN